VSIFYLQDNARNITGKRYAACHAQTLPRITKSENQCPDGGGTTACKTINLGIYQISHPFPQNARNIKLAYSSFASLRLADYARLGNSITMPTKRPYDNMKM